MTTSNDNDCINCPFAVDPHDPYRHVCMKCGREHSFHQFDLGPVLLLLLTIAITFGLMTSYRPQSSDRPFEQRSTYSHDQFND